MLFSQKKNITIIISQTKEATTSVFLAKKKKTIDLNVNVSAPRYSYGHNTVQAGGFYFFFLFLYKNRPPCALIIYHDIWRMMKKQPNRYVPPLIICIPFSYRTNNDTKGEYNFKKGKKNSWNTLNGPPHKTPWFYSNHCTPLFLLRLPSLIPVHFVLRNILLQKMDVLIHTAIGQNSVPTKPIHTVCISTIYNMKTLFMFLSKRNSSQWCISAL